MLKRWQFWVGLVVSAVFLYLALRGVDLAAAWRAALTARWGYLGLAWVCLLASYLLRAWRWQVIVRPLKRVPLWTMWRVFMVGFMSNNILPARAGELVRAYVLGQAAQVNAAAILGTIAVERVFDVAMALLLLVFGVTVGVLGELDNSVWLGAAMVGGIVFGVLAAALWGDALVDWGTRWVGRVSPSWGDKLAGVGRSFVQGLRAVGSVGRAVYVALLAVASWALFMAYAYFILRAYRLHIGVAGVAFLLGMAGLGVSIPSAPGGVGTLDYAYIFGLQLLKIGDENTRASFALTGHVIEWITTLALGMFSLGQLGLSFRQVSTLAERRRRQERESL